MYQTVAEEFLHLPETCLCSISLSFYHGDRKAIFSFRLSFLSSEQCKIINSNLTFGFAWLLIRFISLVFLYSCIPFFPHLYRIGIVLQKKLLNSSKPKDRKLYYGVNKRKRYLTFTAISREFDKSTFKPVMYPEMSSAGRYCGL